MVSGDPKGAECAFRDTHFNRYRRNANGAYNLGFFFHISLHLEASTAIYYQVVREFRWTSFSLFITAHGSPAFHLHPALLRLTVSTTIRLWISAVISAKGCDYLIHVYVHAVCTETRRIV